MASKAAAAVTNQVKKNLNSLLDEDEEEEMRRFKSKGDEDQEPDDIECTPMLIASASLCLAIVTFLLALVASARVAVDELLVACPNTGLSGWSSDAFSSTAVSDMPSFGNATIAQLNGDSVSTPGILPITSRINPTDSYKEFTLFAQPVQQVVMKFDDVAWHQRVVPSLNWQDISKYGSSNTAGSNPTINSAASTSTGNLAAIPSGGSNGTLWAWGYNGQFPGPTMEVFKDDFVRITLVNELPELTSLHIQGIAIDFEVDGQGGVSEIPVAPLSRRVYEFQASVCGSFLYHSGYQTWKQAQRGLFGMIVVHCPGAEPYADQDIAMVASSFLIGNDHDSRNCPAWWRPYYDWFLINGHASPSIPTLKARNGQTIRLRLVSAFSSVPHPIYIHGHQFTVIANGGPKPLAPAARTVGTTVNLVPGISQDIMFTARAGVWPIHSHIANQLVNFLEPNTRSPYTQTYPGGIYTLLCVEGVTAKGTTIRCP